MYIFTIFHHHHATLVFSSLSFVCVAVCVTYDIDWAQSMERPSEASRMNERYSTQVETVSQLTMWCVISLASNREKIASFFISFFILHHFLVLASAIYIFCCCCRTLIVQAWYNFFSLSLLLFYFIKRRIKTSLDHVRALLFSLYFFYFFLFLFFAPLFL